MPTGTDADHMRRALRLAARGRGRVSPNPMVGAVVVDRAGQVVGEGYHRRLGGPHAEIHALDAAGDRARGATMYCTLEPCTVHGRTPPCVDAVMAAGLGRLVCAMADPDPRVDGGGLERLRRAGLEVEVGLGGAAAADLNAAYVHHRRTGRALVTLKLGQTLDGRIATASGQSRWITSQAARRHAHRWRSWVDAVAVGAGTVLADDPQLTVRLVRGRDPRPLVVDGRLRTPSTARLFAGAGPILATSASTADAARRAYVEAGVEVWALPDTDGRIDLQALVRRAGEAGLTHLLIEGGSTLSAAALGAGVVNDVMLYVAPRFLGGDAISGIGPLGLSCLEAAPSLTDVRTRRLGPDWLVTGKVVSPCSPA